MQSHNWGNSIHVYSVSYEHLVSCAWISLGDYFASFSEMYGWKSIWFIFDNLLIIPTMGGHETFSWICHVEIYVDFPSMIFFGPLGLHLLMWSEFNGLGLFDQWGFLECNGYGPSVLHLKWPNKTCSQCCRWPILIQSNLDYGYCPNSWSTIHTSLPWSARARHPPQWMGRANR